MEEEEEEEEEKEEEDEVGVDKSFFVWTERNAMSAED